MLESKIHNIAIEQAVLTALMTVADSLETVINDLDVECFYPERHKQIFRAIAELHNENQPYDVVMVELRLKQQNILHLMGGTEYLKTMMGEAPSSFFNLDSYVATLNKFKAHRELEALGQRFMQLAQDMSQPDIFA
ncbi:DNA helicase, partial [Acinetobacter baumannii]|nr:DNA helicase [Acinetobacter baumannii]